MKEYKHKIIPDCIAKTSIGDDIYYRVIKNNEVLCNIMKEFVENSNDWKLIPNTKYKVGDFVKLENGRIVEIINITDNGSCRYDDGDINRSFHINQIKCKVIPIEKTVYLYEDLNRDKNNNNYVFASSSETNFFKTIDQQQVTFWEELK